MQSLKNLNQTIYILLTICGVLFFFNNQVYAISITSNILSAEPGEQITFTSIVQVGGSSTGGLTVLVDYGDGTSEEVIYNQDPGAPATVSITSNHAYSAQSQRLYTVTVRAIAIGGTGPVIGSNPASMQQLVKGLVINRIQLYFENNRPEVTININQKSPKLFAKIDFSGTGYLKGYWEIDGTRRGYVFKHLAKGPSVVLEYPAVPPIPTFKHGTHNVRLVITDPAMNINFPYAIYFVTSDTEKKLTVIPLIQPFEGENIVSKPLVFKWRPVNKASFYLISIFSKTKQEHMFSAYTRQNVYKLRLNILNDRMQSGDEYIWNVVGFNDQNDVIAESIPSVFSFN